MTEENKKLIEELISIETDECVEWPKWRDNFGYGIVRYNDGETSKNVRVHRLTYIFSNNLEIKDILGKDIHHLCENKSCLNPKHLQLLHRFEHARIHGKFNKDEIKAIRLDKRTLLSIAQDYGVSWQHIHLIKRKKIYSYFDPEGSTFLRGVGPIGKFSDDQIRSIREDKRTNVDIANEYCCHRSFIGNIKKRERYANVPD